MCHFWTQNGTFAPNKNLLGKNYYMKITASVTKRSHQDCGLRYLHFPIFFL